jgi:hypothetical protein
MPCCRNATIVTEFLRDALARGDVGVTRLEIMARTAGLLIRTYQIAGLVQARCIAPRSASRQG